MQSVYSPQVDGQTAIERIRWGKVYGNLPDLAGVIAHSPSAAPLLLPNANARAGLAKALCALFRTICPPEVTAKLQPSTQNAGIDVVQRISDIHRQMAALHAELAELTVAAARGNAGRTQPQARVGPPAAKVVVPKAVVTEAAATKAPSRKTPALTEHQRMQAHLARSFQGVNGSPVAAARALEQAWAAVLKDPLLHGKAGISVTLFGSVGTPLVKDKHGSLAKVLGMQLRKWCVLQAEAAGLKPKDVAGKPSNIRVR